MQQYLLIAFLFLSFVGISQTENLPTLHSLSYDTCMVYSRYHPDSSMQASGMFVGEGTIQVYKDSVTIEYHNKWECGKYSIQLFDTGGEVAGDYFVWYYRGEDEYRSGVWALALTIDNNDKVVYVELFSGFLDDEYTKAGVARVYNLK